SEQVRRDQHERYLQERQELLELLRSLEAERNSWQYKVVEGMAIGLSDIVTTCMGIDTSQWTTSMKLGVAGAWSEGAQTGLVGYVQGANEMFSLGGRLYDPGDLSRFAYNQTDYEQAKIGGYVGGGALMLAGLLYAGSALGLTQIGTVPLTALKSTIALEATSLLYLGLPAPMAKRMINNSPSASTMPQVLQNKAKGDAFRNEIAEGMRMAGRNVTTEVYKKTPFGARYIDIEVSSGGKVLGGIETKAGNSPYTIPQRAKDAYLWIVENYKVNVVRDK
ncbi:MAG: hypothetical protein K8S55_07085, partial [Phycisphaerae bacterium]|nr:hypothetical protein [Phycisphaerae bacterium]